MADRVNQGKLFFLANCHLSQKQFLNWVLFAILYFFVDTNVSPVIFNSNLVKINLLTSPIQVLLNVSHHVQSWFPLMWLLWICCAREKSWSSPNTLWSWFSVSKVFFFFSYLSLIFFAAHLHQVEFMFVISTNLM